MMERQGAFGPFAWRHAARPAPARRTERPRRAVQGGPQAALVALGLPAAALRRRVLRRGLFDGMEANLERKLSEQLQRRNNTAGRMERVAQDLKRQMEEQLDVERRRAAQG